MNRYTVTNLLTGNVYRAEFATQAAFDEWLDRKSQVRPKVSTGFKERHPDHQRRTRITVYDP